MPLLGVQPIEASAATVTWATAPVSGASVTAASMTLGVQATAPTSGPRINAESGRIWIDGSEVSPLTRNPAVGANVSGSNWLVTLSKSGLSTGVDGIHNATVQISDTNGTPSSYSWQYTTRVRPVTTGYFPTGTVYVGRPNIGMRVTDNTPGNVSVSITLRQGSTTGPVVQTWSGSYPQGTVSVAPTSDLVQGSYYVSATAADAAGNTSAPTWWYMVVVPDPMTLLTTCETSGCHPTIRGAHPATVACTVCHPGYTSEHEGGSASQPCSDCHYEGSGDGGHGDTVAVTRACTTCHNTTRTDIPSHIGGEHGDLSFQLAELLAVSRPVAHR